MKNKLTLVEAKKLLELGEVTSLELVEDCLAEIEKSDKEIKAFITLNKNIREEAAKALRPSKEKPLAGIPMAIKDNFLTEGMRTTAASKVLGDFIPPYSATVVAKLKDAGALIIGKTNMDAWAHGSSTETSDFGPTKNPLDLSRVPGGSSGGSAAAVAGQMCIAAIGSETAGSIRGPAAWCGVVGLKPTYGRVSRYGLIAMGSSLDCPGPMTKRVADAALLLEVLAGKDELDGTTLSAPIEAYSQSLDSGVKGLKIGIAERYFLPDMEKQVKELVEGVGKLLAKLGAEVEEVKTMDPSYAVGVYTVIQRAEVSSNLARYDGVRYGEGREAFGEEAKRRMMLGAHTLSVGYQDKYYKKAQRVRSAYLTDFARVFEKYDLLIAPTLPGPAPKLGVSKGQAMFGEMADILAEPSSIAGLPGISVPCGKIKGLPIGVNIMGPQLSEAKILQAAYAYEQEAGI